jgi:hypothetical protein
MIYPYFIQDIVTSVKTICKETKICSHCKLEKAINENRVIEADAFVLGKECTARWLYTEDGLIIHYLKNAH